MNKSELNGDYLKILLVEDNPELSPGKYAKLKVTDTGAGIETGIIDKIFEPFFTTKEQGEGNGMGLAVVHGIVKSHKCFIDVHSEPGKGTTFEILFPKIS